jgi:hypothetical protein
MSIASDHRPQEPLAPLSATSNAAISNRQTWIEITRALVLALATVASAWCAYQSTRWNDVQTFRLTEASEASRQSAMHSIAGMQVRSFDGTMFLHYLEACSQGQKQTESLLLSRFRPELKVAMEAWLKTRPFDNPHAPPHPFRMSEYVLDEEVEAARLSQVHKEGLSNAQEANRIADAYVLLTVMFASVLFFGGIGGTASLPWLRQTLGGLATMFFFGTILYLATMPICRE